MKIDIGQYWRRKSTGHYYIVIKIDNDIILAEQMDSKGKNVVQSHIAFTTYFAFTKTKNVIIRGTILKPFRLLSYNEKIPDFYNIQFLDGSELTLCKDILEASIISTLLNLARQQQKELQEQENDANELFRKQALNDLDKIAQTLKQSIVRIGYPHIGYIDEEKKYDMVFKYDDNHMLTVCGDCFITKNIDREEINA